MTNARAYAAQIVDALAEAGYIVDDLVTSQDSFESIVDIVEPHVASAEADAVVKNG